MQESKLERVCIGGILKIVGGFKCLKAARGSRLKTTGCRGDLKGYIQGVQGGFEGVHTGSAGGI